VAAIETHRRDAAEARQTDVVETQRREVRAEAKYVRTAPRKAQLVAAEIRGRSVPEARTILAFMTRDAARDVEKVLASAVANAEQNHGLVGDDLYVSSAYVGAGPVLKRWRARARGRVARIRKRTCHIAIALSPADGVAIPEPRREATVEAPTPEEEKPKRAPRRKTEPAAEAVEEKPKRASRKADEPAAEADEKPKRRASRKKKTDTESEES
jgi:large subunit ribosomal protein L22